MAPRTKNSRRARLDIRTRLQLLPDTAAYGGDELKSQLTIGGCDVASLADQFGTPLYIFDRQTLDHAVQEYEAALRKHYPAASGLTYAGKAFLCTAMAQWAQKNGLRVDCSGQGELHIARQAGVPRELLLLHGVNKSPGDLSAGLADAGTIVIDNLGEVARLLAAREDLQGSALPEFWLRWRPGVAVQTHRHTQTGQDTSKFGMDSNEILTAVQLCRENGIPLAGIHFHQGSHFHDPEPLGEAISVCCKMIDEVRRQWGWLPETLCPGGGWGVAYNESELPHPLIEDYARVIAESLQEGCKQNNLPLPRLVLEPGRSLVARAGVAIYRVGTIKQTHDRRWLLLDGGLADNPRPALYQTRYTAVPVVEPWRPITGPAWLGGPYCESGDILIEDLPLPDVRQGELLAVPMSGAYHLSMGSNYNGARKPAVIMVRDGAASLIQRRETLDDLTHRDLPLPA